MYTQENIKISKIAHQSPQQKRILTQLTKNRMQEKMWLSNPTHILSQKKIRFTQSIKQRNHKHPNKQLIPKKKLT